MNELHSHLQSLISARESALLRFEVELMELERKRALSVGAELIKVTKLMISIAHLLPVDIEKKLVENEAYKVNSVLLVNKQVLIILL